MSREGMNIEEVHHDPEYRKGGPMLMVISGPSGVGKDSVIAYMRRLDHPWYFVVTATTRLRRSGEQDGVDYIFTTPDCFEQMVINEEFLEYAEVYGHRYGVPYRQVKEALERGLDVVVKTDVQGAAAIRQKIPQSVLVFLAPPSVEELELRLRQRKTESVDQLELRIQTAFTEMKQLSLFDYAVVNYSGRLQHTVDILKSIAIAERWRIPLRRVGL